METIDPDGHEVVLAGGERIGYGKLVIATGARPRPLPLPGADLVGVHTYRTLADAESVRDAAEEAPSAIVVGGSFIGSETAASLRARGLDGHAGRGRRGADAAAPLRSRSRRSSPSCTARRASTCCSRRSSRS